MSDDEPTNPEQERGYNDGFEAFKRRQFDVGAGLQEKDLYSELSPWERGYLDGWNDAWEWAVKQTWGKP